MAALLGSYSGLCRYLAKKGKAKMTFQYGPIRYTAHGHRQQSEGLVDGKVVVVIRKNKNHTYTNSNIYSVFVEGRELPRGFRTIHEARAAGQQAYEASHRS